MIILLICLAAVNLTLAIINSINYSRSHKPISLGAAIIGFVASMSSIFVVVDFYL
jgi:hypothetical protein